MSSGIFEDLRFLVAGRYRGTSQAALSKIITQHNGSTTAGLNENDPPSHLCLPEHEFSKPPAGKLTDVLAFNEKHKSTPISIVNEKWILDSVAQGTLLDDAHYRYGVVDASSAPASPTAGTPVVASQASQVSRPKRASKRSRDSSEEKDAKSEGIVFDKNKRPVKKSKHAIVRASPPPLSPKFVQVIVKDQIPVDSACPIAASAHVYVDAFGVIYDATLNQTNIVQNNNKFYYIQLLQEDNNAASFYLWTHWGRVGENGQDSLRQCATLDAAVRLFTSKFKSKTKLTFENRHEPAKPGAYAYIERSYEDDNSSAKSGKSSDNSGSVEKEHSPSPPPESLLETSVQDFVRLIFDVSIMQYTMTALNYDANKLPLGKLSENTLRKGNSVLKEISDVIGDATLAIKKHGGSRAAVLATLTSQYYTIIPHAFGRQVPPVIDTLERLKREAELVESLGEMEIATEIISNVANLQKQGQKLNTIDRHFQSLQLTEFHPLHPSSDEYQHLCGYLRSTHGATHTYAVEVSDIFRVRRNVEDELWNSAGWGSYTQDNRWLLWHGSRVTNFAGILSQGLRIAPPEAPVSGYMFGKGIYLANMASKSAGYCRSESSNGEGLLLLCEAQLGNPMYQCEHSDPDAARNCEKNGSIATHGIGSTRPNKSIDAGVLSSDLAGVMMPAPDSTPECVGIPGLSLHYDEFIVYDVSQVKIRYLFRVKL